MALRELASFTHSLRAVENVTGLAASSALSELVRTTTTGLTAFDSSLRSLSIVGTATEPVRIANQPIGAVYRVIRSGDLGAYMNLVKSQVAFSSIDASSFSSAVGATPERALHTLNKTVEQNSKTHPDLLLTADDLPNASASTKEIIKKAEQTLLQKLARNTSVLITVGIIVVTSEWAYKSVVANRGCFMLTTINGKTTSCRIKQLSCTNLTATDNVCTTPFTAGRNYTLLLMVLVNSQDTDTLKTNIANDLGLSVADLSTKIATIIDTQFETLRVSFDKHLTSNSLDISEPCSISNPLIEQGKVPDCRMCNPSASPKSTEYVNLANFGDNITFNCNANPTILQILTDATIATGIQLLDSVGTGIRKLFQPLLIVLVVIVVLCLVVYFALRFRRKPQSEDRVPLFISPQPTSTSFASRTMI